ncbi:S-adenosyl-L-methionine-dependent methyltransferase [Tribonema minus]|uniref:DNA (cytosine-5-)-methyltransferase n=1 Tax=Tribonema minus TaxID=303371 RepID=A0A836CDD9_9STRA|nr:S-adenosyl-L-methionine-dependent methyltransferase [Tribonema minus]
MLAVVDLFCGIRGFSEGAAQAGASVVLAVDSWASALDAHASRHPEALHWREELGGDVAEFAARVRAVVPPGARLHMHGSPPCQQLSSLKQGGDRVEGLRLVTWYLNLVDALAPDSWTMEQVPHPAVLALLRERGAPFRVLRFDDYGVPNRRRRAIAGTVDFDALRRKPAPSARSVVSPHEDISAFSALTDGNTRGRGEGPVPRSLGLVSTTVTRSHPRLLDQSRRRTKMLGLPALLALQSFPPDFSTAGLRVEDARTMIGNAVSPAVALELIRAAAGRPRSAA